jgi:hypothetical protein
MARIKAGSGIDYTGTLGPTGIPTAVALTDSVPFGQLIALLNNLDIRPAARLVATTNIALAAPPATIDGVTHAAGDRILVTAQTTASQNGIYVSGGNASPLTRSTGPLDLLSEGAFWIINEGVTNADTAWIISTQGAITVGTTAIAFSPGPRAGIAPGVATKKFTGTFGDGASLTFNVAHALGTTDVETTVYLGSAGSQTPVITNVVVTDANTVQMQFDTAPATNNVRVVVVG